MKMRKVFLVVLALIMVFSLVACGGGGTTDPETTDSEISAPPSEQPSETNEESDPKSVDPTKEKDRQPIEIKTKAEGDDVVLGFVLKLDTFVTYVWNAAEAFGKEHDNVTVHLVDSEADVAKELQAVENFIQMGCDAVLIQPTDSTACGPLSEACTAAGIPLFAVNTNIDAPTMAYIGSDHYYSGQLQAEYIAETTDGTGNYAIVMGDLGSEAAHARTNGVKDTLAELCPDMKFMKEQTCNWVRDEAITVVENWLQAEDGADINYIFANNDEGAVGAAIACQAMGRPDIQVLGIDASEEGLKYVEDGRLVFTVFQNGWAQGWDGCQAAVDFIYGKDLGTFVEVPYEPVPADRVEEIRELLADMI
ncbi:MAG: substrate-binding domain-containing protein [Christensenellales bacterium]